MDTKLAASETFYVLSLVVLEIFSMFYNIYLAVFLTFSKKAMTLKFWLRLVRMFKSISWKFVGFSIVYSCFIKGHLRSFFWLCSGLNNSRTKQATTLKFWLRLVWMFKSISWKFAGFSIVLSRFIKGHFHSFFGLCRHLNNSRTKQATALKFWLRLVQMFKSISWTFGAFSIVRSPFMKGQPLTSFFTMT